MDPGRRAMIYGRKSPPRRDITSPRRDSSSRITKPSRPTQSKPTTSASQDWLSQDEQSRQFVADEDKFVLKQAKKKADIRVREGRAKPVDLLAFNLRYIDTDRDVFDDDDADVDIDVPQPDAVIDRLKEAELDELEAEITPYHTLETNAINKDYWKALRTICADRRQRLKPMGPEQRAVSSVIADVDKILGPKNLQQLEKLEGQIQAKLRSDEVMDTDYWEQLLKSLQIFKAKAKLKNIYEAIRESRVKLLKDRDPEKAKALAESESLPNPARSDTKDTLTTSNSKLKQNTTAVALASSSTSAPPPGTARFATGGNEDFSQATKALYEREVARGVSENEEIFTAEESVSSTIQPQWADKYRPRKPRYFNRVQMGYEWNKYNQTHYDHDNPPPKVVQGYKFNIFYPDLIDKTKAPTFKIIREHGRRRGESFAPAGEEDTCLIRFIAGPPYEDIAFRIVDREWDYSAKKDRGFKSSFDKGILQLHFQFKKIYYRK
ncbi:mid region of cactin-domain-containing protein [Annulohypoxylon maeteangense]|uniref:mid region of cactin-domain-containing protein n=1 Tax=Annulohypoxylon maeteangense TaxID=1927788 RepID=UPI0020077390|nr:mid region of cactin-domain-containing protein [Annulohypoxylon maeteangense]KAI0881554.1 mid region of cactin-domain-containing protein [Annulohypoxylon maeteangense]